MDVDSRKADELPPWDDDSWLEASDDPWQRRLRYQQAWWRANRLEDQPPGPIREGQRLVVSMLPIGVGLSPNLMTGGAVAEDAMQDLAARKRPGMIQPDRLKRNLLSSQPMCFNLFGHLSATPDALLPWVQGFSDTAVEVTAIKLEWAPSHGTLGGSAFDAFVEYRRSDGKLGFLGIECKYAENLKKSLTKPADEKYRAPTERGEWVTNAFDALDKTGLRQFWFNQLLTRLVTDQGDHAEGTGVVMACSEDAPAREAVDEVRAQLADRQTLKFSAIEDAVREVTGQHAWRQRFHERYLDFSPIRHLLDERPN